MEVFEAQKAYQKLQLLRKGLKPQDKRQHDIKEMERRFELRFGGLAKSNLNKSLVLENLQTTFTNSTCLE